MKNVMVCVTQQKSCDRLIRFGYEQQGTGELYIIHVTKEQEMLMGNLRWDEALDYLYEKAKEYEGTLTVMRSDSPIATLRDLVQKHHITHVVMGSSRQDKKENNFIELFRKVVPDEIEIMVVPE